ncbi:MAG: hypothetical protein HUU41_19480 [Bryobacteraceae bacterium]|nr:hypothetical protein [Bryobacteraceae bacterium]
MRRGLIADRPDFDDRPVTGVQQLGLFMGPSPDQRFVLAFPHVFDGVSESPTPA